jgi:DnaK suppressor protein
VARRLLAAERTAALARVEDLGGHIAAIIDATDGANSDDEHDPEGATIAFERAQAQALQSAAAQRLGEIDAALERLRVGGYGDCVVCGRPIDPERLLARPTADRCVGCVVSTGVGRRRVSR